MSLTKPVIRPIRPFFSSGPCAKRPGWSVHVLEKALVGRSHRSKEGRGRLKDVITRSKDLLNIPDDWRLGIIPASDTGAVELLLWAFSVPHETYVDVLSFDSFSETWAKDLEKLLTPSYLNILSAPYGELPDFTKINWDHDVVLTWNGTTSGVCIPDRSLIPEVHKGLVICDATSAAFVMDLPWDRLDCVTWSWQKALGGEAAHGMLALSPAAVKRLEALSDKPLPKIFTLTKSGHINEAIFQGDTINTPSMLCVEDALDSLKWAKDIGGVKTLRERSKKNLKIVEDWVNQQDWIEFLCDDPSIRSSTAICLKIIAPWFIALDKKEKRQVVSQITALLEGEKAGFDLASYRDAPAGIRIWGGATVEAEDIEKLLPWLSWAYETIHLLFTEKT